MMVVDRKFIIRGLAQIVTDGPSAAKEHTVRAPADAAPRDLNCGAAELLRCTALKTVCQKLKPFKRSMFLEFRHKAIRSRAPPA